MKKICAICKQEIKPSDGYTSYYTTARGAVYSHLDARRCIEFSLKCLGAGPDFAPKGHLGSGDRL